nr:hypothetical protein [Nannocystaceae bacterium]
EAIVAAAAIDLRPAPTSGPLRAVHAAIREVVPPHRGDRSGAANIEALADAILAGRLRRAAGFDHELGGRPT